MRIELNGNPAEHAAKILKEAINKKGSAVFIAATGNTQIKFLQKLAKKKIKWSKTTMFHLDEYIGIKATHKASFRNYLNKRLVKKVHPGKVNLINGEADPKKECERLGKLISKERIDVAFLGVGVNGHLAFNDPPADFQTAKPFIVVKLGKANRKQQVAEGWFSNLREVPAKAISMSIKQIMKAKSIICLVYGKHKARIVKDSFSGKISSKYPASILQNHKNAVVYLDKESASLL